MTWRSKRPAESQRREFCIGQVRNGFSYARFHGIRVEGEIDQDAAHALALKEEGSACLRVDRKLQGIRNRRFGRFELSRVDGRDDAAQLRLGRPCFVPGNERDQQDHCHFEHAVLTLPNRGGAQSRYRIHSDQVPQPKTVASS